MSVIIDYQPDLKRAVIAVKDGETLIGFVTTIDKIVKETLGHGLMVSEGDFLIYKKGETYEGGDYVIPLEKMMRVKGFKKAIEEKRSIGNPSSHSRHLSHWIDASFSNYPDKVKVYLEISGIIKTLEERSKIKLKNGYAMRLNHKHKNILLELFKNNLKKYEEPREEVRLFSFPSISSSGGKVVEPYCLFPLTYLEIITIGEEGRKEADTLGGKVLKELGGYVDPELRLKKDALENATKLYRLNQNPSLVEQLPTLPINVCLVDMPPKGKEEIIKKD